MHTSFRTPAQRGFTLIELMITVSIAGILSSVALPSFENQLQKARRSDVLLAAMQVQAAQERFRSNAASYGGLAEIGVPATTTARHYTLQIAAYSAEGYELLAAAAGAQARPTSFWASTRLSNRLKASCWRWREIWVTTRILRRRRLRSGWPCSATESMGGWRG